MYRHVVRPLLFSLPPETAHHIALAALQLTSKIELMRSLLRRFQPSSRPVSLFGLNFPHPVGLAAGFDKNGLALPAWAALGFAFIEIGTVTARPQPGNPKPRIFRYPNQKALINRLGFNNDGADIVANRLRRFHERGQWPDVPVGINIGKSKSTPLSEATADYLHSFRRLRNFADYVVLNISSPNTPDLRSLQEADALSALLNAIAEQNKANKPILIKLAPDLEPEKLEKIIAVSEQERVAGIIATNTTLDHTPIPSHLDQEGGMSGAPLQKKSTAIVRNIAARTSIPVIASGGIVDAESAREKIKAGAQLLQIYTGYIFRGPGLLREIVSAL